MLGTICRLRGVVWVWVLVLVGWFFAGLLDPLIWKRLYGRKIGREASLIANLDMFYLFSVGWFLSYLKILF